MHILCDHSVTKVYRIKLSEGQHYDYEVCDRCGLSPDLPALTSSGPDELLPWWDWKPVSGKRITDARPGINRVQARRTEARDQVQLLQQLIEWERELGETPDPDLAAELEAAEKHRADLGYVFVAN
jgi:hypothetical protein